MQTTQRRMAILAGGAVVLGSGILAARAQVSSTVTNLSGMAAMQSDWTSDAPGVRRTIRASDLPKPYESKSVDNGPRLVAMPDGAWPKVPAGFEITRLSTGLTEPRVVVTAPNGDLFIAESKAGRVHIIRSSKDGKKADLDQVFATGFNRPFGIAFWPKTQPRYIYVANTDGVVRMEYRSGDKIARGAPQPVITNVSGGGQLRGGGHWTRDIQFSQDERTLFLSVGSLTNVNVEKNPIEANRARIFAYTMNPDGLPTDNGRVYADGIRNPVGLAIQPRTGTLWTSVNERDELGDNLVPDYITSVKDGGFYGWPWFYIGANPDPRKTGERDDLKDKVVVPDVLLQSHYASLDLAFYDGNKFPKEYQNNLFAAQHGSWNRSRRVGYKIVRVLMDGNRATGTFEDFVTGFVTQDGNVWGRPVGVTTAKDGALIFTDDGSGSVWRVAYTGVTKTALK